MTRFKQKLIKGLSTFLLAVALLFPKAQAQERVIIDNFSQPNDTTLNYYGSGDINKDNTITWQDASRLDSLIQGTFTDPLDDRLTDRADINGDGVKDNQDKQTLGNYLNQNINYLPSNWNKSNTVEKTSWFEKIIKIDKTDTISLSEGCDHFAIPLAINFNGFSCLEGVDPTDFEWEFSKTGRFNMPIYYVTTTTTLGKRHAVNGGLLIGKKPFDFYSWKFTEPSNDDDINAGDWNMAKDNYVKINKLNINKDGTYNALPIITWYLDENGIPTIADIPYNPYPAVVPSNPNKDTIPPEITLTSPIDSAFYNSSVNLEYLVKENQTFLDSAYYGLNDNKQYIDCVDSQIPIFPVNSISGIIPLASEEGEYDFIFYAKDIAKPQANETIKNIKFFIDKAPPEVNMIYPEADKDYVGKVDSMVVAVTDAHPGDTVNYTINGTDYFVAHSDTITVNTTSIEGQNTYSVSTTDKAGNPSYTETNFNIVPDAVEEIKEEKEKTLESYFKVYPNPASDVVNFEFSLEVPQNLRFRIQDITGRQLEQRVIKGNLGENKVLYDFSKYASQICIYTIKGDKGYVKTGKVVKK